MTDTPDLPSDDGLEEIAHASGDRRDQLIEDFLRSRTALLERVTRQVLWHMGQHPRTSRHREDVESTVWECGWQILRERRPDLDQLVSFGAVLTSRSKREAVKMVESPAVTGASGTSGLRTRQRAAGRSRAELRRLLGVEPDVDELVEFHNSKVAETRSNPAKQGALVTREELDATPGAVLPDSPTGAPAEPDEGQAPISSSEGREMVAEIIDRCDRESPEMGRVARSWLGEYAAGGYIGSSSDPSREATTSREVTRIRSAMLDVRVVAREVALEWIGHREHPGD